MSNFFQALFNRNFLFLWLSELFSQLAMNMMNFMLLLVAFRITNSNTAVSGIVLSFTIPSIIFGVLAGAYVDRWNKKYVLFFTNATRMAFVLLLVLSHSNLVLLYIISFVIAVITQFFIPAETPLIPQIVAKKDLISANALFSLAWFGSVLLAYGLSGPFLLILGIKTAFLVLSLIFLFGALFALLIQIPKQEEKKGREVIAVRVSLRAEIKNAIDVIVKIRDVSHAFFLLAFSQVLILIISVLGPGYAHTILRIDINQFPLLFVTPAIAGMAIGSVLVANIFHRFSRHKSSTLGLFLGSFAVLLMPYASKHWIHILNLHLPLILHISTTQAMVGIAFILGLSNAFMWVPSNTLLQENTSDAVRGKVYGALNTVGSLLSLLPVILVGSLADIFGVSLVLTLLGILIGIIGILRITL